MKHDSNPELTREIENSRKSRAALMFARCIADRCNYQCPAVQNAIDRLVEADGFRGRCGMIEALSAPHYSPLAFNSALLSAWKAADILLATDRSVDWWLNIAERTKAQHGSGARDFGA